MDIIYPPYYESFRCIASSCPDSCCKEWDVDIDEEAAVFYRNLPGPLGDKLRQVLQDTEDGTVMVIENGRCPMWQDDGLCHIQAELGHDALCHVCQQFPRLRHDYGSFVELGLELSCPEAARLILNAAWEPPVVQQTEGGDLPDYEPEIMDILLQTRETALQLLSDTRYSVPQAFTLLYFHAHNAQTLIDGGEPPLFEPDEILLLAGNISKPGDIAPILAFFRQLEILNLQWSQRLLQSSPAPWGNGFRNLARYFVERYWLQAVSDYDLLCRVKFIIISCLTIRALGGDFLQTCQQYSKEIENSSENLNALLDAAYTHPAFTDELLLGLLREDALL